MRGISRKTINYSLIKRAGIKAYLIALSRVNYTDDYCVYQVLGYFAGEKYTYTVESYNSYCRSHLAKLARDTKSIGWLIIVLPC